VGREFQSLIGRLDYRGKKTPYNPLGKAKNIKGQKPLDSRLKISGMTKRQ